MSMQNVERFIRETEQNEKLQERVKAAMEKCRTGGGGPDRLFEEAVRPFAEELGLAFSEEEYRDFLKEHAQEQGQELSIDGLDAVTGGIGDVSAEGTDGSVTVVDQSQTTITTTTTTFVQVGPSDMSFLSYLVDKFY